MWSLIDMIYFTNALLELHNSFGNDQEVRSGLLKAVQRMKKIKNASQYASFLHSIGSSTFAMPKGSQRRWPSVYQRQRATYLQYGRIGASKAAKQRRVPGSNRGNMRLPGGGGNRKRPNNISKNVRDNVPNGKSR